MIEIERKFLVGSKGYRKESFQKLKIKQGYLNSHPERTVRVRTKGEKGFITIKGISSASGLSRYEWEKEISLGEAEELLNLCEPGKIEKVRFLVNRGGNIFEIDEFSGANEGLIIAEIELSSEGSSFQKPDWLGEEVTGDIRYYNSYLSKKPFKNWEI